MVQIIFDCYVRHLDLSQSRSKEVDYSEPNYILNKICKSLPLLQSLDVSGTNLAGTGMEDPLEESSRCDITLKVLNFLTYLNGYFLYY